MNLTSITKRILLWFLLLQGVLAASGVIAVLFYVRREQRKAFDADLRGRMTALLANLQDHDGTFELQSPDMIPAGHLYVVRSANGRILAQDNSGHTLSASEAQNGFTYHGIHYRGDYWPSVPPFEDEAEELNTIGRVDVLYAMSTFAIDFQFRRLAWLTAIATSCFLLLSALLTWWAIVRGLAPLHDLAERAAAMDAENWRFEVPAQTLATRELAPLGKALLHLLARLKSAFDRERRFVSDAGHELKTAVAIQKSTLQLLEREVPNVAAYKQGIKRALEDTARAERLVQSMLSLAATEARSEPASVSTLDQSLTMALNDLNTMAHDLGVKIRVKNTSVWQVVGDANELSTVWRNLLENALQHGPRGSEVSVTVEDAMNEGVEVSIADSGPGIAPEHLPHLFERFYRVDQSRSRKTGGFGLGLAIARSIVEKYHGRIEVESALSRGTCVVVHLAKTQPQNSGNGIPR